MTHTTANQSMSPAKREIFNRIRQAGPIDAPEIPHDYRMSSTASREQIVAEMEEALIDYTATVTHATPATVPAAIEEALADKTTVVLPPGLPEAWVAAAESSNREVRVDDPPLSKDTLDNTEAVLTGARAAVSLSGTIMLDGSPDQGRRIITLLPDCHVIVLPASSIYATVPEAVELLAEHPTRPTTWIAGPSATSDIELVRVDGVHGPRTLRVIIVDDAS
ncbi:MAG: LutC/YkgG family protein [Ancrocorticia sp.]|uniref:LutC/YkgG family protein n=1 Tax=Ancrocorticia sp. TaxID=2593684 RepID=UPI003F904F9A